MTKPFVKPSVLRAATGTAAILLLMGLTGCPAFPQHPDPSVAEFARLHRLIEPQPGEAKWATVPWRTDLAEARRQSAALDRPLFVWRAGGGEVLGRA